MRKGFPFLIQSVKPKQMLWKTAESKLVELNTLENSHLCAILRMVRNKNLVRIQEQTKQLFANGANPRRQINREITRRLEDEKDEPGAWLDVIESVTRILKKRKFPIPEDLTIGKFAGQLITGTPDLVVPALQPSPRFDPQNKTFVKEIREIKAARTPPKPRTRDILDY